MAVATALSRDSAAPQTAPTEEPIDRAHLVRMTLDEPSLQREVLALFDRQASLLLERMRQASPGMAATAAHTLKGSAQGIGAWRVARAAQAVEQAEGANHGAAIGALAAAIDEARRAISALLRAH
jgi:HPt (histidine-containing phosphotransfer) domain-containing protein